MAGGPVDVPETIVCVECGDNAHLLTAVSAEDPAYPGDVLAYRCSGCNDRFDVEMPDSPDDQ